MDGFDPGTGLGPRLRLVRGARGLSVRELARRVGCSASLISQIERGVSVPSVGVLYSLATELGSSLDYLLFGSETVPAADAGPVADAGPAVNAGPAVAEAVPAAEAGPAVAAEPTERPSGVLEVSRSAPPP